MKRFYWLMLTMGVLLTMSTPAWTSTLVANAKNKPVQATRKEMTQAISVQAREEAVALREEALDLKEQELIALEAELDAKLARYATLQDEVAVQIAELTAVKDKRFKNLVAVYSTMSPSKVAPLLDSMEDATVADLLQAMKTDLVAKIIPKLSQDKAVRVSKRLGLIR